MPEFICGGSEVHFEPKSGQELIEQHINLSRRVPVIKDTNILVSLVLDYLVSCDWDIELTQPRFPDLNPAQIRAVFAYGKTKAGKDLLKQKRRNGISK